MVVEYPVDEDQLVGWEKCTLAGQDLLVRAPVAMQPAVEFVAGIKIGRARYDERTGAFYLVIDDFSGGIGFDVADLREELGVFWDTQEADGRRSRHLTLPPLLSTHATTPTFNAATTRARRGVISSAVTNVVNVIAGRAVYYSSDGTTFAPAGVRTTTGSTTPAITPDATLTPDSWSLSGAATKHEAVQTDDGDTSYIYGTANGQQQFFSVPTPSGLQDHYQISSVTVSAVAKAMGGTNPTIKLSVRVSGVTDTSTSATVSTSSYSTVSRSFNSAPGKLSWNLSDLPNLEVGVEVGLLNGATEIRVTHLYVTVTYSSTGTEYSGLAEVESSGWKVILWSASGTTIWYTDDGSHFGILGSAAPANVADIIYHAATCWIITTTGLIYSTADFTTYTQRATIKGQPSDGRWVGPYIDINGATSLYFTAGGTLAFLDISTFSITEIALGAGVRAYTGTIWQGGICTTDGQSVLSYQVSGSGDETLRELGLVRFRNLPPDLIGCRIRDLAGGPDMLWAYCETANAADNIILGYNGQGWQVMHGPHLSSPPAIGCFDIAFAPVKTEPAHRALYFTTRNSDYTQFAVRSLHLPLVGEIPVRGQDSFEVGPTSVYTPTIDGGFAELHGTLLELSVDGYLTDTEKVEVYYAVDSAVDTGTYTKLGEFTASGQTLVFGQGKGVPFRIVRFRFDLSRGSTVTTTPDVYAFVLKYQKKPELRMQYQLNIDVTRMMALGNPLLGETQEAPTFGNIYNFLRDVWDSHELVELVIPGLEDVPRNVELVAMPMTATEIAESRAKGIITIQCVEPLKTTQPPR